MSEVLDVEYVVSDGYSGVEINGQTLDSTVFDSFYSSLGANTLTITASDQAGNVATGEINFEIIADTDSTIADVERAYAEGMITREQIKLKLIKELEQIKEYLEKYGQKEEKKKDKLKQRLNKCAERKDSEKCEERTAKLYDKTTYKLDKVHRKIIIKKYETILKNLKLYYTKGWLNEEGYGILKADIEWLVEDIQES